MHLHGSNKGIESHLKELLKEMKEFKLYATMKILFKKPQGDNTLYKSAYFHNLNGARLGKTETVLQ